jgi:hypothetical protein
MARTSGLAVKPPSDGQRTKDMFVGAPGDHLGGLFGLRISVLGYGVSDLDIG